MGMAWEQWAEIVGRLNASYPEQQIEPPTAREWYDELAHLDSGDIWLAIRRLRTEQRWRPGLAEIRAGVTIYRRELAEQASSQQLRQSSSRKGTPMPPETRQTLEVLKETLGPDVTDEQRTQARQMIDTLADRLEERLARVQLMTLETA